MRRDAAKDDKPRRIGMRLRPSLSRRLTALAVQGGRLPSDLLNEAVADYVAHQEKARKPARGRASLSA